MSILCYDMLGNIRYQSSNYNETIIEMQKQIVSFELKLFKKILKEANQEEVDGACKFFMQLYETLLKNNLKLSFFVRDYKKNEIDDARIITKILLNRLPTEYRKRFKRLLITHGKPTARVFIDDNIFEYSQIDNASTKIVKSILPLFNVNRKYPLMMDKFILGVDFDGVIHEHNVPFEENPKDLFKYNINKEIRELLQTLKTTFDKNIEIDIVTMRAYSSKHTELVHEYLKHYKIPYDEVTNQIHPKTNLMIDDNAVLVQNLSDINGLIPYIKNRLPWYKKLKKEKKEMATVKKTSTKKVAPKKAATKKAVVKKAVKKPAAKKTAKK